MLQVSYYYLSTVVVEMICFFIHHSNQELQQLQRGVSSIRTDFHPIFLIVVLQELLGNLQSYCRFDFWTVHHSIPQIRSYSSYRKVFKVLEWNFTEYSNFWRYRSYRETSTVVVGLTSVLYTTQSLKLGATAATERFSKF